MGNQIYTVITFAPVQGFIEKSRKLRDLYGSSFILSYLAKEICESASKHVGYDRNNPAPGQKDPVVSPAIINVTQGTPNQIVIRGEFPREKAEEALNDTWKKMTYECRCWVEETCEEWIKVQLKEWINKKQWESESAVPWKRNWELWTNHAWEFFHATGGSISEAREKLNEIKRARNWTAVNWIGESSTLSGADGIAWPGYGRHINPKLIHQGEEDDKIRKFYQCLSKEVGKAFIDFIAMYEGDSLADRYGRALVEFAKRFDKIPEKTQKQKYDEYGSAIINPREQISIPELVKRMITLESIAHKRMEIPLEEIPVSYRDLSRLAESGESSVSNQQEEDLRWTGWFLGDGDKAGDYLQSLTEQGEDEEQSLNNFSRKMMEWGEDVLKPKVNEELGQIIYAGGDDFFGVFYRTSPQPVLKPRDCLEWFYKFKSYSGKLPQSNEDIWSQHKQPITVSVGFVWAAPSVPQRDLIQHCNEAEKSAKRNGRDRIALRILFAGGNYLEWICPWGLLERILTGYQDRNGMRGKEANWGHIYGDVNILKSRHALTENQKKIARALFEIYFPNVDAKEIFESDNLFNSGERRETQEEESDGTEIKGEESDRTKTQEEERARTGILGQKSNYTMDGSDNDEKLESAAVDKAVNDWVVNLAQVGFHFFGSFE